MKSAGCFRASLVTVLVSLIAGLPGCGSSDGDKPQSSSGGSGNQTAGSSNQTAGKGSQTAGTSAGGSSSGPSTGGAGTAGATSVAGTGNIAGQGSGGVATGPIECRAKGDGKSTITMINNCTDTVTFAGSKIQGGDLKPGEHACRDVGTDKESIPAIRFWGYIGQDPGNERYTLAELTLNTTFNDFDWYNISHVDASNLAMQVSAVGMDKCRTLTCPDDLLANCPAIGQEKDANGKIISCFNPTRDDKNSVVAQYFEKGCADAYSWSGDDQNSVVACAGEDYDVVFCP